MRRQNLRTCLPSNFYAANFSLRGNPASVWLQPWPRGESELLDNENVMIIASRERFEAGAYLTPLQYKAKGVEKASKKRAK